MSKQKQTSALDFFSAAAVQRQEGTVANPLYEGIDNPREDTGAYASLDAKADAIPPSDDTFYNQLDFEEVTEHAV